MCLKDDNVTTEDLFKIASWDAEAAKLHLGKVNRTHPVLYDLLRKLLEPQVPARKQHFPSGMQSVLAHPFFRGGELDSEVRTKPRALELSMCSYCEWICIQDIDC